MVSLYDHRWFIGGGGRLLQLHGRIKVAASLPNNRAPRGTRVLLP